MAEPRYTIGYDGTICEDCGVLVARPEAHTRFHSIMSAQAWALAVLQTAHIAAHVHDRYEVYDKISSKKFGSWSGDALAEVIADHGKQDFP